MKKTWHEQCLRIKKFGALVDSFNSTTETQIVVEYH